MAAIEIRADDELETMITIARRAGERLAALYREHETTPVHVELKGPDDPVTAADREVNQLICDALGAAFNNAAIVSEEDAPSGCALDAVLLNSRVFFVDPLDGTREFVARNPEFAVMIGLAVDGCAAAGVVQLPMEGRLVAGRVGARAFVEQPDGSRELLSVTPCNRFQQARLVVSRSHRPSIIEPLSHRLGIRDTRPCGSVGVKVARIALSEAELYVHAGPGLKRWDTCASDAVLAAAGGRLSDLDGAPIDYRSRELALGRGLVASNGLLHPGILSAVGWAEREVARLTEG